MRAKHGLILLLETKLIQHPISVSAEEEAEQCHQSARKHTDLASWIHHDIKAYQKSIRLGVIDKCLEHMPTQRLIITSQMRKDIAGLGALEQECTIPEGTFNVFAAKQYRNEQ